MRNGPHLIDLPSGRFTTTLQSFKHSLTKSSSGIGSSQVKVDASNAAHIALPVRG